MLFLKFEQNVCMEKTKHINKKKMLCKHFPARGTVRRLSRLRILEVQIVDVRAHVHYHKVNLGLRLFVLEFWIVWDVLSDCLIVVFSQKKRIMITRKNAVYFVCQGLCPNDLAFVSAVKRLRPHIQGEPGIDWKAARWRGGPLMGRRMML